MNVPAECSSLPPAKAADILDTPLPLSSLFTLSSIDAHIAPSFTFRWLGPGALSTIFRRSRAVSFLFQCFRRHIDQFSTHFRLGEASSLSMARYIYNCRVRSDNVVEIRRQSGIEQLEITFKRTVRIPDNNDPFKLPLSLGTFPLYETEKYAQSLPETIASNRGVLLPMYREYSLLQSAGHEEC